MSKVFFGHSGVLPDASSAAVHIGDKLVATMKKELFLSDAHANNNRPLVCPEGVGR
jgi:hypothetical protein